MKAKRRIASALIVMAISLALLLIFVFLDLSIAGKEMLSITEVVDALLGHGTWANDIIVNGHNVPRIVFGIGICAGLAVTGGVMQAVFRNPLATPYILGLSSGASLGAALAIIFPISLIPMAITQPLAGSPEKR